MFNCTFKPCCGICSGFCAILISNNLFNSTVKLCYLILILVHGHTFLYVNSWALCSKQNSSHNSTKQFSFQIQQLGLSSDVWGFFFDCIWKKMVALKEIIKIYSKVKSARITYWKFMFLNSQRYRYSFICNKISNH